MHLIEVQSALPASLPGQGLTPYVGGLVRLVSNAQLQEEERRQAESANAQPVIQGLAAHIRSVWQVNWQAKQDVEQRMLKSVRQRRGEYDPEILAEIKKGGGSEIYMMLTSNKCRAAASWLRDVMLGTRDEKPWTLDPTPLPDLPPVIQQSVERLALQEAAEFEQLTGQVVGPAQFDQLIARVRDRVVANARARAKEACARMERKMEDQLVEGGFHAAFSEFIDDLVTFPAAIIEGPVVARRPRLAWVPNGANFDLQVRDELVLEWRRVDPFMVYPSPNAADIDDGPLIIRRQLSREALNALIDVEGYNSGAIRAVLDEYGRGGLREWLYIDSAKAQAEGRSLSATYQNVEGTIDALQFFGSVQGKWLIDWGMDAAEVPEPTKDYQVEAWLIGRWVIKAMINPDPLARRNLYKASYEEIPGSFWGNSVADLARDCQTQCNNAARAIANNMGISSGPQVVFNVDRLPAGEDLTQMYPWKVWQATSDPYGSTAKPVDFFMPASIAGELMQIYTFFSTLADEHTGVPRYMAGDATGSGALRTSSGMSMLMSNAGKAIKQVVANIDGRVISRLIDRLHYYNMRYGEDPELKGDVRVRARGAATLIVKEQAQVRMNEFLNICLSSPVVANIVGEEAIAALLRESAKTLDLDTDKIVPPPEVIRARTFMQQMALIAQQTAPQGKQVMPGNGQQLQDGTPVTDNFTPARQ